MNSADVRQLLRELEEQEFSVRRTSKGHLMITDPRGVFVTTLAGTTGDFRSIRNALAALRRAGFTWKGR